MRRQGVLAEIQVLYLSAILADSLHQVDKLPAMDLNALEVQLLDLWHVEDHALEALHENDLIYLDMRQAQSRDSIVHRLGQSL